MSKEMWEKIVGHAKQCEGYDPTHYLPTLQVYSAALSHILSLYLYSNET